MPLTEKQLAAWKKHHGDREFKIGKQYYKSGWLKKAPENALGRSHERWFELRHYVLFYYKDEQTDPDSYWGWNYPQWGDNEEPPEEKQDLFSGLSVSLPSLSFPDLSMPDLSMPDISMPDISMPDVSLSAPSLSMPSVDLKAMKMPKRKERDDNSAYGMIQIYNGAKIKRDGKTLVITDAVQYKLYKNADPEEKKGRTFKLTAPDDEEAESWYQSIVYGGCQEA